MAPRVCDLPATTLIIAGRGARSRDNDARGPSKENFSRTLSLASRLTLDFAPQASGAESDKIESTTLEDLILLHEHFNFFIRPLSLILASN